MIAMLFGAVLGLLFLFLWLWALIDVIRAENAEYNVIKGENAKILWLVVVLIVPFGSIIYAVLEKRMFMRPGFKVSDIKSDFTGNKSGAVASEE